MKVAVGVGLLLLSITVATWLYWGQPLYLVAFAGAGVIFATYIWLMGYLFKKRLSMVAFLSIWALVLASMSLVEVWRYWQSPHDNERAIPSAVQVLAHRTNPYLLPDKKPSATPPIPAAPPLAPSVIDNLDERKDLGAVVLAEKCNDDYLEELRSTALSQIDKQVDFPSELDDARSMRASAAMIYASKKDQELFEKIFQQELQNFRTATEKGQGILNHFSGPHVAQARDEFLRIEGELISRAESTNQQLMPYFELQEQLMAMALYVKQGGQSSSEYRSAWVEDMRILSMNGRDFYSRRLMEDVPSQHEEVFRKLMAMTFDKDYSHKAETFLLVRCAYKLPKEVVDPNLVGPYVDAINKTWQSDVWLIKGRPLAENVYESNGSKLH